MALKDLLRKKERIEREGATGPIPVSASGVKIIRTTTTTQEILQEFPPHDATPAIHLISETVDPSKSHERHTSKDGHSTDDSTDEVSDSGLSTPQRRTHRLSARLEKLHILPHHNHSRSRSRSQSRNLPENLPSIEASTVDGHTDSATGEAIEARWEKRATILALDANHRNGPSKAAGAALAGIAGVGLAVAKNSATNISSVEADVSMQEAIRLHESGELEASTRMFGILASPSGENNALAQVLYGLALRHGWGVEPDLGRGVQYLAKAASNSATVEKAALTAGINKGGAAKGELVLAIYELGNSYRHGWGVEKDPIAARAYYETAANLGDVDAMIEVAGALEHGWGGRKDKFQAAQYLRRAEEKGRKEVGNSWIWKEKYDPK